MDQIECELYEKSDELTVYQRMIGYWQADRASDEQAQRYSLVEFYQTVRDDATKIWLEGTLADPFYATGLDTIPMSVQDKKAAYVSQLLSLGYSFQGKVLVNASTQAVEPVADAEVPAAGLMVDGAALNWLLTPPAEAVPRAMFRGYLNEIFSQGALKLGFEIGQTDPEQSLLPDVLMHVPGQFELRVEGSLRENTLHPATLEGAGELKALNGHKPLLMLLYLQQRLAQDFSLATNEGLAFCDEQGQTFRYEKFDSLEPLIERFGFDAEQVRRDAEQLGLVAPIIRLAEIQTDAEDFFF